MSAIDAGFAARVAAVHAQLGITAAMLQGRELPLCPEPAELVVAHTGSWPDGSARAFELTPAACAAWRQMHAAAAALGVPLEIVSAYRSVQRQAELIRDKLGVGQSMVDILRVNAPPGHSEHHSGRAIDIGTSEAAALEEVFEDTPSFAWLCAHAGRFGFAMSYPRGNPQGFVHEPWHWCFHPKY